MDMPLYDTIKIQRSLVSENVIELTLNRPDKLNAVSHDMFKEIAHFLNWINTTANWVRCVVLLAEGKIFSPGIDVTSLATITATGFTDDKDANVNANDGRDVALQAYKVYVAGKSFQASINALEHCNVPVIACIHNACIGAGLEMVSAADVRFCTSDAYFVMKEIDVGLAADVGGLQRFPKVVGNNSLVRELAFSGRKMDAKEAMNLGFVSRICRDKDDLMQQSRDLAKLIASKSPVAILGAKKFLNFNRDHSVEDSLEYAIAWNMAMTQGNDMQKAVAAAFSKKAPVFNNLPKSKL